MIWSFAFFATLAAALFIVDKLLAAPKYDDNSSNHFDGSKFVNPDDAGTHRYWEVLKWWLGGNDKGTWHKLSEDEVPSFPAPSENVSPGKLEFTFINHASFLIQVDGLNILTDPIWSYRASPYQWIGPKRMRPPGLKFDDLPPIDIVLLSHNHYDHLDLDTVLKLHRKYDPRFVVPLGVEKLLHDHNIDKTVHLDWWDRADLSNGLNLTAVPSRHFSGRGLFDRNKTLWCGYVLHTSVGNIYFAGDSGYGPFFKEIGKRFGPMHISFIPIGAYKPRWFMHAIHMDPEEAVEAHKDVQSQQSYAMHFGTFPMADDGMYEPSEDLQTALNKHDIADGEFKVPVEGKPYTKQVASRQKAETAE